MALTAGIKKKRVLKTFPSRINKIDPPGSGIPNVNAPAAYPPLFHQLIEGEEVNVSGIKTEMKSNPGTNRFKYI